MEDPGSYFLQQYTLEASKKSRHRRMLLILVFSSLVIGFTGWLTKSVTLSSVLFFEFLILLLSFSSVFSFHRKAIERQETLFMMLEVDPALLENPDRMHVALEAVKAGNLQSIQVSKTQRRGRGSDEKGFTSGQIDSPLDATKTRRDSSVSEPLYEGLEDNLRPSELLVNEANLQYQHRANQLWQDAESKDTDLIEAGVERLGDLVKTDWFEKNSKQGAVQELMDSQKPDEEF